ncbi:MAG: CoA pyrophosphatase [Deltaproteobacteria bacterium]|nr:CoA pyrophosphatase [Deltaproteobacteria bacterium]
MLNFVGRVEEVAGRERIVLNRPDLTRAAVLLPIVFRGNDPHLILTKRTMTVATHKGQISFPGGVREPEDQDESANALREAHEEIGLDPKAVKVVGLLDDFVTTTGFSVTPVVGFVETEAELTADPVEVAEIIEAPLAILTDPSCHELKRLEYEDRSYEYHQYEVGEHIVWGATAGIIHRFLTSLEETASS